MSQVTHAIQDAVRTGREVAGNNRLLSYAVAGVVAFLLFTGRIGIGLPAWWPVGAICLVAAWFAGKDAARRIDDEIEDPEGVLLVSYDGERIDEFTPDEWAEMNVAGSLYQWPDSPRRTYECAAFHPERDWVVGNWKESFPGSEVGAQVTPADAIATVEEYRREFEPELAEARHLKRNLRSIVRKLDKQRAEEQDKILDKHTAPSFERDKTVTEILREDLPEDLHPQAVKHSAEKETEDDEQAEPEETGPSPETTTEGLEAAPDGGEPTDE